MATLTVEIKEAETKPTVTVWKMEGLRKKMLFSNVKVYDSPYAVDKPSTKSAIMLDYESLCDASNLMGKEFFVGLQTCLEKARNEKHFGKFDIKDLIKTGPNGQYIVCKVYGKSTKYPTKFTGGKEEWLTKCSIIDVNLSFLSVVASNKYGVGGIEVTADAINVVKLGTPEDSADYENPSDELQSTKKKTKKT